MGKKRRRVTSPKFARKFATKFAKFKAVLEETVTVVTETYKEIVEEKKEVEEKKVPKVIIKEVDESATAEPKPKTRSRKISPRKKMPDSKKPAKKRAAKNV